jgi:acyl-CoA synthetase (NDP forming)
VSPDPLAEARAEGRALLTEVEAYAVLDALGIAVPDHVVAPPEGSMPGRLPAGERLVVKVLSPGLLHKSDRGGVRLVPREGMAAALGEMAGTFQGVDLRGFLVAEEVAHPAPGEILLGIRRTPEFGTVVAVGLGGLEAELLATALPPCLFSAETDGGDLQALLDVSPTVRHLTAGRPGSPPAVEGRVLKEFLLRLAVAGLPPEVVEVEVNPLVFREGRPLGLDAVVRLGEVPPPAPPRPRAQLERLLRPGSIAVVGVSERMNPGRVILRNILAAGFPADRLTVVKPGSDRIDGCRCVPDLASLAGRVDLLVLSIAAAGVPQALQSVMERGTAAGAIVIPGGLGERAGSEELADAARATIDEGRRRGTGPVVNGGNSMGIRSLPGRYDATFIPAYKSSPAAQSAPAPLAVISQSGALAIARLDRFPFIEPRYLITVGNQVDLTVGDYLDLLADDPEVAVAACYLEGFRPGDGRLVARAARRLVARGGAVIAYLAGRTPQGAASAATHTASIAGDPVVARSLLEQAGALVAATMEEFEDLVRLALLLRHRRVEGTALGAVSNAGFEVVSMADNLGPFSFPRLGPATVDRLRGVLQSQRIESIVAVANPLDLTPVTGDEGFAEAVAAVLVDDGVQVGMVGCVPLTPALSTLEVGGGHAEDVAAPGSLAGRLTTLWRETAKAWVVVVDGGALYDPMARLLEREGVPVFRSADRAAVALARYCVWRIRQSPAGAQPR